jgi:hypothetical protein
MTLGHISQRLGRLKAITNGSMEAIHTLWKTITRLPPCALLMQADELTRNESQKGIEYKILKDFVEVYAGDTPAPILVFGDSVFLRVANDDCSPQSLGSLLNTHYKEGEVFLVCGSGYHLGVFEQFCKVLATLRSQPRLAVVPINLRSFSPTWDLNPLYQFHAEIESLSSFDLQKPDYRMPVTRPTLESEGQLIPLELECEEKISLKDFLSIIRENPVVSSREWKERLRKIFQHHYMSPLFTEHRKLKNLKETLMILRNKGVSIYCYLTPINYEAGAEFCGRDFAKIVNKNICTLKNEIKSIFPLAFTGEKERLFRFDDFSFEFRRDVFFTSHNATEHLRIEGRNFIARKIVEAGQVA